MASGPFDILISDIYLGDDSGLDQDLHHRCISARTRQRQRRLALAIGKLRVGTGLDQQPHPTEGRYLARQGGADGA